jgi:ferredoxin-type protein NapF
VKRTINRTQFLRGDLSGGRQVIRPPWSKGEALFTDLCQRCDDCIKACPEQILKRGLGGYPRIDFSLGRCSFCRACVEACRHPVFETTSTHEKPAWELEVSITQACLSLQGVVCRSCGDACDNAAIRFQLQTGGRAQPQVVEQHCNGCGECFAVCPKRAITILPSQRECAA